MFPRIVLAAVAASLFVLPGEAIAQPAEAGRAEIRAGDMVVLIDAANLKTGATVVADLPRGTEFQVFKIQGNWLGGSATVDGKKQNGWVEKGAGDEASFGRHRGRRLARLARTEPRRQVARRRAAQAVAEAGTEAALESR